MDWHIVLIYRVLISRIYYYIILDDNLMEVFLYPLNILFGKFYLVLIAINNH